jgi:hypothetical protein
MGAQSDFVERRSTVVPDIRTMSWLDLVITISSTVEIPGASAKARPSRLTKQGAKVAAKTPEAMKMPCSFIWKTVYKLNTSLYLL